MIYVNKDIKITSINDLPSLKIGDEGEYVKFLQEWLCLSSSCKIEIDGDFGPATQEAVADYKTVHWLDSPLEIVTSNTWSSLLSPMIDLQCKDISIGGKSLTDLIVSLASYHVRAHPQEVGGQNKGPWVRYYMQGNDGADYAWCAGAASTIVLQAIKLLGKSSEYFNYTMSCDVLMQRAQKYSKVLKSPIPGCLFLKPGKIKGDWVHTGIVTKVAKDRGIILTAEGNTSSDSGEREGYEFCMRYRKIENYDYILAC